jgi:hypothetical protein
MTGRDSHADSHQYRKLVANQRAKLLPCWLCGQPIDYRLDYPDPDSYSYDHAKAWIDYPHLRLDPDNGRSAHLHCNQSRGKRDPAPGIGIASEKW